MDSDDEFSTGVRGKPVYTLEDLCKSKILSLFNPKVKWARIRLAFKIFANDFLGSSKTVPHGICRTFPILKKGNKFLDESRSRCSIRVRGGIVGAA